MCYDPTSNMWKTYDLKLRKKKSSLGVVSDESN